jgi:arsenite oxidase small subunit
MDDHVQHEAPVDESIAASQPARKLDRRGFLKMTTVSGAAAALAACSTPPTPTPEAAATAAPAPTSPPPTAVATVATAPQPTAAPAPPPVAQVLTSDLLPYPRVKIGTLGDLGSGVLSTTYPDPSSLVQVLKLGAKTVGGVGPDEDIVAYSGLCTHMGCPVLYDAATKMFKCPCHYSHFDAAADAMMINGPATQHLPRLVLEVDGEDIYAVGVQGLIYGRAHNVALVQ